MSAIPSRVHKLRVSGSNRRSAIKHAVWVKARCHLPLGEPSLCNLACCVLLLRFFWRAKNNRKVIMKSKWKIFTGRKCQIWTAIPAPKAGVLPLHHILHETLPLSEQEGYVQKRGIKHASLISSREVDQTATWGTRKPLIPDFVK